MSKPSKTPRGGSRREEVPARRRGRGPGDRAALHEFTLIAYQKSIAVRDYLDWFEASQGNGLSGKFDDFLNLPKLIEKELPPRSDPISKYLDAIDQGRNVNTEPLILLCNKHQDACACAGLAYINAAQSSAAADCTALQNATAMDPKWPCTCRKYNLWRAGQSSTTHCGIPRCE